MGQVEVGRFTQRMKTVDIGTGFANCVFDVNE